MASTRQPGQADRTTQSDQSLSRSSDSANDDGQFSVAEEVNLDEQSGKARQVGQIKPDADAAVDASDAMGQSMTQGKEQDPKDGRA
jgi:hypothetical protein